MRFRRSERLAKRTVASFTAWAKPPDQVPLDAVKARAAEGLQHILLVRHHQHRGDLLLATPVFRALRERYPDAHIALIAGEATAEVVERNPHLSQVHVLRRSIWLHQWDLRALRKALRTPSPADMCFMLSTEAVTQTGAAIARLSGADIVVGFDTAQWTPGRREADAFYNCAITAPAPDAPLSETERALGLLAALDIPLGSVAERMEPVVGVAASDTAWAREMLKNQPRPLLAYHAGGTYREKAWPLRYYAYVHEALHETLGGTALAIGGPGEEPVVTRFKTLCHRPPKPMMGMTFGQLAAVLKEADFFIGNDTGPLHVAAGVGTPALGVFLTTDPARWLPHGEHVTCVARRDGHDPEPDEVTATVRQFFETGRFVPLPFRQAPAQMTPDAKLPAE